MREKLFVTMLTGVIVFGLVACGAEEESAAPVQETSVAENTVVENTVAEEVNVEPVDDVKSDDFTLLDVTTDMIQAGYYTCDDANNEMVVSLFLGPDGSNYVSLIQVPAEGDADLICGSYTADDVTQTVDEENGVTWTSISFTDVYTNGECTVVFGDGDDGSCGIANEDFSIAVEGKYLTADETINYMGAALSF